MRYAVGVANLYESRIQVFVVEAPTPLLACKGVMFDLVGNEIDTDHLTAIPDMEELTDLAIEFDLSISSPVPVHESTELRLPDPRLIFDDDAPTDAILTD
jgi:hypothetical protein